jgi:hypothetical protein
LAGLVQFSRLQIEFEDTEANAKWQRVLHQLGEMWGKVYTAPPSVPSEVCSLPTEFNRVSPETQAERRAKRLWNESVT